MNELLQSFIEDHTAENTKTTPFPAPNSTSAFQISSGYMHVIVAIYAIVVALVIFIIIIIVVQSVRNAWTKKDNSGYGSIPHHDRRNSVPQRVNHLDPDVEILDSNTRTYVPHQDDDSEYDNISLNLGGDENDDDGMDTPPLYENPPSYLSINR